MRAYYDEMDRAISGHSEKVNWNQEAYTEIFPPEVIAECRLHLDRALEAGGDSKVKTRVEMICLGFEYFQRYMICLQAPAMKMSFEEFTKARNECEAVIDKLYAINKDFILAKVAKMYLAERMSKLESKHYVSDKGLVNHWMLLGPFDNARNAGHSTAYPPEKSLGLAKVVNGKDGKQIEWFEYLGEPSKGIVDLGVLIQPKDWSVTYAVCRVNSPKEQAVQFRVGSNDSIKTWLNEKQVWDNPIPRGRRLAVDDDIVSVALPKGESQLLLKIANQAYDCGFCFRITDDDGNAIKNLHYRLSK